MTNCGEQELGNRKQQNIILVILKRAALKDLIFAFILNYLDSSPEPVMSHVEWLGMTPLSTMFQRLLFTVYSAMPLFFTPA